MAQSERVTIYSPNRRHEYGLFRIWVIMARNVYESRELIWQLFKRDFFAQYKKSFFGYAWVVMSPIFGIASWVFLQATGVLNAGDVGIPYPAYVLIGTSMWGLFIGFFQAASSSLKSGEGLMTQVKFAHEALFVIQMAQHLANFSIVFILNMLILIGFGVVPAWQTVFLPLVCLPMMFLGSAIGLINSLVGSVSHDMQRLIPPVLGLLLYITPIIYSDTVDSPMLQTIVQYNPLTYLVCSARDIILKGQLYDTQGFFIYAGISLVAFLFSWRMFFISEDRLIERLH